MRTSTNVEKSGTDKNAEALEVHASRRELVQSIADTALPLTVAIVTFALAMRFSQFHEQWSRFAANSRMSTLPSQWLSLVPGAAIFAGVLTRIFKRRSIGAAAGAGCGLLVIFLARFFPPALVLSLAVPAFVFFAAGRELVREIIRSLRESEPVLQRSKASQSRKGARRERGRSTRVNGTLQSKPDAAADTELEKPLAKLRRPAALCVLGVLLVVAFWGRLGYTTAPQQLRGLAIAAHGDLDADAQGYFQYAATTFGYNTSMREPLWIWWIQAMRFFVFGGSHDVMMTRLAGVASGLVAVAAVFGLALRRIGLLAAIVAGAIYATAPFLVDLSCRGLREDAINVLMIAYVACLMRVWGKVPRVLDCLLIGVAAAALCLLRLNSMLFVFITLGAAFAWSCWRNRKGMLRAGYAMVLLPIAIVIAAILPHCVEVKRQYGDPFFAMNKDIRFYANQELAGTRPDFPTRAEFEKEAYTGGKITMGQYLFKYHSIGALAAGVSKGAQRLFAGDFLDFAYSADRGPLLMFCHWIGLAAMLLPGRRLLLLGFLLFSAPSLFLASFAWFDMRLLVNAFVLFYIGFGAAAQTIWDLFWRAKVERSGPWPWQQKYPRVHGLSELNAALIGE